LHGVFSRRASRALRPSFAGDAALARRCEQLPAGAGTPTRLVMQGQERSTIERDRVIGRVVRVFLVCATVADRLGVTHRSRETLPMRFIVRRLAGVAKRLIAAAIVGDDGAFVKPFRASTPWRSAACR